MKRIILCESNADAALLMEALPQDIVSTSHFFASQGKSVGLSRARSLLSMHSIPLLLVEDADTMDGIAVLERVDFVRQSLAMVARNTKFDVSVIVPEMEVLFFQTNEIARTLLGERATAAILEQGMFRPKDALIDARMIQPVQALRKNVQLKKLLANSPLVTSLVSQIRRLDS